MYPPNSHESVAVAALAAAAATEPTEATGDTNRSNSNAPPVDAGTSPAADNGTEASPAPTSEEASDLNDGDASPGRKRSLAATRTPRERKPSAIMLEAQQAREVKSSPTPGSAKSKPARKKVKTENTPTAVAMTEEQQEAEEKNSNQPQYPLFPSYPPGVTAYSLQPQPIQAQARPQYQQAAMAPMGQSNSLAAAVAAAAAAAEYQPLTVQPGEVDNVLYSPLEYQNKMKREAREGVPATATTPPNRAVAVPHALIIYHEPMRRSSAYFVVPTAVLTPEDLSLLRQLHGSGVTKNALAQMAFERLLRKSAIKTCLGSPLEYGKEFIMEDLRNATDIVNAQVTRHRRQRTGKGFHNVWIDKKIMQLYDITFIDDDRPVPPAPPVPHVSIVQNAAAGPVVQVRGIVPPPPAAAAAGMVSHLMPVGHPALVPNLAAAAAGGGVTMASTTGASRGYSTGLSLAATMYHPAAAGAGALHAHGHPPIQLFAPQQTPPLSAYQQSSTHVLPTPQQSIQFHPDEHEQAVTMGTWALLERQQT